MSNRNPIARTVKRQGWFDKPPIANKGCQLVVFPLRGIPYLVPLGSALRNADFKAADTIYEVDTNTDSFTLEGIADSLDDAVTFEFRAAISYRIQDPLKIVQRAIADTRADVQRLVGIAINSVTRDCSPDQFQDAQRAVRRGAEGDEGTVAQRLQANGYMLEDLTITLLRDKEIRDLTRQGMVEREKDKLAGALREREVNKEIRDLTQQSEIEREKEKLAEVLRTREANQVKHIRSYLSGDLVTLLSFSAAQGADHLHQAIKDLSDIDKKRLESLSGFEIKVLEQQIQELPAHKRKELFDEILMRQKQSFNASRLLQGESHPPPPSSAENSSERKPPAEDSSEDGWDD